MQYSILSGKILVLMLCMSVSVQAQKTKTLTILHTNDVHSRIEALSPELENPVSAGNGGFLRIASYVNEVRKETSNLLVFDCGDFSQGTPYYNLFQGDVEISLMNTIGYNAGAIGNHEFDFGMDNLMRLCKMANFPVVCANYDFTETVLEGIVKPYTIIKKAGLKIGVFGLSPDPDGLVQASNYEGVKFLNPYEKANETAALLRQKGCNVVICLSHLGMYSSTKNPISDTELVKNTRNIDVILGGHSHTLLEELHVYKNLDGKEVYISQMGKSGIYVGRIDLTFEK
ncbi:bifunctional UDP-sugar hydrolase/5'-nucleotidase [Bacteroides sp. 519]|uniref:bifunctional metallophosphatase/5'-nucleotidase n=1 Tax=Bacteroides sp. 519 TaxID=2302937 RepID=UPI0013D0D3C0|nr:metallophosphatase [Bacteroides sp. 519]NDV59906.1 bifunctional metallophosphatase/5'-nucleotidase [Bacteroides sp. 519]